MVQDLTYSVKSHHDKKVTLNLLSSISGFFNSGEMSALVCLASWICLKTQSSPEHTVRQLASHLHDGQYILPCTVRYIPSTTAALVCDAILSGLPYLRQCCLSQLFQWACCIAGCIALYLPSAALWHPIPVASAM